MNNHVNGVVYVNWLMDSYSEEFHRQHRVKVLEVNFVGETRGLERQLEFTTDDN